MNIIKLLTAIGIASLVSCVSYQNGNTKLSSLGGQLHINGVDGSLTTNHEKSFGDAAGVLKHGIWGDAIKSIAGTAGAVLNTRSGDGVAKAASNNGVIKNASNNALEAIKDGNATSILLKP